MQHCDDVVQAEPVGAHSAPASVPGGPLGGGGGGAGESHLPSVQLTLQQSAPVVQVPPLGVHGVVQVPLATSQCFEQHSASFLHEAV